MKETVVSRGQQAFRLKGTAPALTLLYMLTEDLDAVEKQLSDHLRLMPQFFLYAPMLVDLTELGERRIDLAGLADLLRRHKLVPVAVRNPTDAQQVQAVQAGWAVLQSGLASPRQRRGVEARAAAAAYTNEAEEPGVEAAAQPAPAPNADPSEQPLPGLTIKAPVRSGQVIHAVGGDLVVLAPVSVGAEIIADGNIHVYAPLRGKALAGAQGNSDASIFCLGLEAEFLSIAGRYLMADQIPDAARGQPARAYLDGDSLMITTL
ncbi:MAG: septum site-determining protein MinC [Deltaproteobacteria bacterium]